MDGGSRWGIRGSVEAGEGLTANYRFEHKISTADASQSGGRLANVGLSGGFGSVTLGQIWNAAYNSVGAITDNSWHYGDAETGYRHGSAISYAFSNDMMALQLDAVYADAAPGDDLGKVEFGLSVNIGDLGKVAVATIDDKYKVVDGDPDAPWKVKHTLAAAEVSVSDITMYVGTGKTKSTSPTEDPMESKTTFFGARGGLGDSGISYVFQWRD